MVAGRSSSADMAIAVIVRTSAATFPSPCVHVASPGPSLAQAALSSTMMLVPENGRAFRKNESVGLGAGPEAVRLAHRSRWQKAAGQRENSLQLGLTLHPNRGSTVNNP